MPTQDFAEAIINCPTCGRRNRVFRVHRRKGFRCGNCHADLDNPFPLAGQMVGAALARPWWTSVVIMCIGLLSLGAWAMQSSRAMRELEARLPNELTAMDARHAESMKTAAAAHADLVARETARQEEQAAVETRRHREFMADTGRLSGEAARRRHEKEWSERRAYAPRFAATPVEKVMLQMHQVSGDKELPIEKVIERVALLASPPGSLTEVRRQTDGLSVNVAFRMSALSSRESGAVTGHTSKESLREEAVNLCAKVMRDLYEHCGTRDIADVQLACNHAAREGFVPPDATDSEAERILAAFPVAWTVLYHCSLRARAAERIPKWHDLSPERVKSMLVVEQDRFSTLRISGRSNEGSQDEPIEPLKFR